MIENLLKYYRAHLTFYGLIVKNNKWKNIVFGMLFVLIISSILVIQFNFNLVLQLCMLPIPFTLLILLSKYVNVANLQTIKNNYPQFLNSDKKNWSNETIHKYILEELDKYLDTNNLKERKIIDEIQRIIIEKAKNEKIPFIIYSGCFAGLSIPLWNAYVSRVFDIYKTDIKYINLIAFTLVLLISVISFLIPKLVEINENFFSRYSDLNKLNELIDEYKLTFLVKNNQSENKTEESTQITSAK